MEGSSEGHYSFVDYHIVQLVSSNLRYRLTNSTRNFLRSLLPRKQCSLHISPRHSTILRTHKVQITDGLFIAETNRV